MTTENEAALISRLLRQLAEFGITLQDTAGWPWQPKVGVGGAIQMVKVDPQTGEETGETANYLHWCRWNGYTVDYLENLFGQFEAAEQEAKAEITQLQQQGLLGQEFTQEEYQAAREQAMPAAQMGLPTVPTQAGIPGLPAAGASDEEMFAYINALVGTPEPEAISPLYQPFAAMEAGQRQRGLLPPLPEAQQEQIIAGGYPGEEIMSPGQWNQLAEMNLQRRRQQEFAQAAALPPQNWWEQYQQIGGAQRWPTQAPPTWVDKWMTSRGQSPMWLQGRPNVWPSGLVDVGEQAQSWVNAQVGNIQQGIGGPWYGK